MVTTNNIEQKLISFIDNPAELEKISQDMKNGWSIISLVKNGSYYVGIMELNHNQTKNKDSLYIPPRKKIKILK